MSEEVTVGDLVGGTAVHHELGLSLPIVGAYLDEEGEIHVTLEIRSDGLTKEVPFNDLESWSEPVKEKAKAKKKK